MKWFETISNDLYPTINQTYKKYIKSKKIILLLIKTISTNFINNVDNWIFN